MIFLISLLFTVNYHQIGVGKITRFTKFRIYYLHLVSHSVEMSEIRIFELNEIDYGENQLSQGLFSLRCELIETNERTARRFFSNQ